MRRALILSFFLCFTAQLTAALPVLVTIAPIKFFVEAIGGDLVDVDVLVPPGAGAHTYEPTPRQLGELDTAKLWFTIGEPFEDRIAPALPGAERVDLRSNVKLLYIHHCEHCEGGADPHIWMSPRRAEIFSRTIAEALIKNLPEHREVLERRSDALKAELKRLDASLQEQLAPCRGEAILVSHPAFGYFCDDYDLRQLSVEFEGKEPTPRQVAKLVGKARKEGIGQLILDTQYSAKGARLVAQALGVPVCPFDPLAEDYIPNMHKLADCICHE